MNYKFIFGFFALSIITAALSGCDNIKNGIVKPIITAYEDTTAGNCKDAEVVASEDANTVITLKSSHDQTFFIVDGKKVNEQPLKLLKVCVNRDRNHKIIAQPQPEGCNNRVEYLEPPYHNPYYDFQFMLGDCPQKN
jgi:hypothetical protein